MEVFKTFGKRYVKFALGTSFTFGTVNAVATNFGCRLEKNIEDFVYSDEPVFDPKNKVDVVKIQNSNKQSNSNINTTVIVDTNDVNEFIDTQKKEVREYLFKSNIPRMKNPEMKIWIETGNAFVEGTTFGLKLFTSPLLYPVQSLIK